MFIKVFKKHFKIVLTVVAFLSSYINASNSFFQFSIPVNSQDSYKVKFSDKNNIVELIIYNTTVSLGEIFDSYDNSLVQRVIIKEERIKNDLISSVKIYLNNNDINTSTTFYNMPNRIVVDIYNKEYEQKYNPLTGFPTVDQDSEKSNKLQYNRSSGDRKQDNVELQKNKKSKKSKNKLKLLVPNTSTDNLRNIDEITTELRKIAQGEFQAWSTYPPYIFKIQTAIAGARSRNKSIANILDSNKVISIEKLANYAAKLKDYGHERRALVAYQYVVEQDARLLERSPLHLWNFAELYFAQGELNIAQNYYNKLVLKYPSSIFSAFAQLREVDIMVLHALSENDLSSFNLIQSKLDKLKNKDINNIEYNSQYLIRSSFILQEVKNIRSQFIIPKVSLSILNKLKLIYQKINVPRTKFVVASIIINNLINQEFTNDLVKIALMYFDNNSNDYTTEFKKSLKQKLYDKLLKTALDYGLKKQHVKLVKYYDKLPASLKSIDKNEQLQKYLALAYFKTDSLAKASQYYSQVSKTMSNGTDRFQSIYKATQVEFLMKNIRTKRIRTLNRKLETEWRSLNEKEKQKIYETNKDSFIRQTNNQKYLRLIAGLLLSKLENKELKQKNNATTLLNLINAFTRFGQNNEKKRAYDMLLEVDTSNLSDSLKSRRRSLLLKVARRYRKQNKYLKAGQIYTKLGDEDTSWSKRAESLYKGGLLLFRSGRTEEAIKTLEKSANDANNSFYANLAKERLSQLKN